VPSYSEQVALEPEAGYTILLIMGNIAEDHRCENHKCQSSFNVSPCIFQFNNW